MIVGRDLVAASKSEPEFSVQVSNSCLGDIGAERTRRSAAPELDMPCRYRILFLLKFDQLLGSCFYTIA